MEKTNTSTNFTWIKFFNAMLKKICSEYDKKTLWEVFKKVYAGKFKWDLPILTENPGEIDPFTFIAMLNSNDKKDSRIELCQVVKEELNISEAVPLDFDGIVSYPPKARFFYTFDSLDVFHETIDSLWKLAQCVVGNDEITNDIGRKIDVEIEDINEQFFLSWVKICKILFVCFPDKYFPADTKICAYSGIKSRLDNFEDFKKYQQALKDKFNEPPYIVSYKAINGNSSEGKMKPENQQDASTPQYWLKSSNPNTYDLHGRFQKYDCDFWPQLYHFNVNDIVFFYSSANDRRIRFKTIVEKINITPKEMDEIDKREGDWKEFWNTEKYTVTKTDKNCVCLRLLKEVDDDSLSYENLIKLGYIKKAPQGAIKITNQEFIDFLNSKFGDNNMSNVNINIPLNQILYGPPGTGKTYNTVIKAMEIINPGLIAQYKAEAITYYDVKKAYDEAKKNGQIEFVTFHQSYAYEEFVEGIKPDLDDYDDLKYEIKDGIFKTICDNARQTDNFEEVYKSFINELLESEEYNDENPFPLKTLKYQKTFGIYPNSNNNLTLFLETDKKAQATLTKEGLKRKSDWTSYSTSIYEYLMQKKGLKTTSNIDKSYVLIIDEINRGNISKIFGELITLIEPDKRQGAAHEIKAKLPYSQNEFTVPQNLYIIGTMNTSDRSIATVDIALRRRFKFIEMMPDKNLVADFGIGFKDIFEKLNTRIKLLLDRDHQIGHSYFINTKYKNADAETLKEIWFSEIIPLLNEYFYCDWEKLRRIIPGFLKQVPIPDDLKGECEDSIYEFKTREEVSDLKAAFEQKDIKKDY